VERISEFLFGLTMVLTLTCTFNVREANHSSVRTLLKDALGCNVAWGVIAAFFYLLNALGQRDMALLFSGSYVGLRSQARQGASSPTRCRH
jgi:hypothetical protein